MAFRQRFELGLLWRLALIAGLATVFVVALSQPGLIAVRTLAALAAAGAAVELWHYIGRTNRAVARFIDSVRFEDFAQRFALGGGGGFDALGASLDRAIVELGARRAQSADEARFLGAVVDDAPVALLMIDDGDRVTLLNKAARQQFALAEGVRLDGFAAFGAEFVAALTLPPTGRRLTRLMHGGIAQRTIVEAARIDRVGSDIKIVSVLPVQNVLGAAEMAAQGDLVRVLTHEIMNSLTPVTSLARTAADLMAAPEPDYAEVRGAIDTVARRAEGMHRFVESYRAFARAPEVRRRHFEAAPWAAEIARLFGADTAHAGVALEVDIELRLVIDGDPELLAQLCLNLLRNAATAAAGCAASPRVCLRAAASGAQCLIEIVDNGPGIDPALRDDVFLPFYTTRADGNGVGLSFARQIAIAHGGSIAIDSAPGGGALVRLLI